MSIDFLVIQGESAAQKADAIVVSHFEDDTAPSGAAEWVDKALEWCNRASWLESGDFSGKSGSTSAALLRMARFRRRVCCWWVRASHAKFGIHLARNAAASGDEATGQTQGRQDRGDERRPVWVICRRRWLDKRLPKARCSPPIEIPSVQT